ncbi:MAG: helix-hairpin-helix domain-containing protein [Prevotella sp.]|nr:helix-hairpin-helix domain-containing protein [Prevotella sp.]
MRLLSVLFLLLVMATRASEAQTWHDVYDELVAAGYDLSGDEDDGTELLAASYELLEQLATTPLDLNSASREELEQLPFLSAQQIMDLQEYVYRYGPMRSLGELRMVQSLDYAQLSLLPFFVYVSDQPDAPTYEYMPRLDTLLHHSRHTLIATARIPFYRRKGDRNGYLGYPYRHSIRYELSSGQHLRLGLIGAQDAGEPFFSGNNRLGYDVYSYYFELRKAGRLRELVVGKYKLSAGMGLVAGQSFMLGKLATLQSLGRTVRTIRPHCSRSEADYFQGAAATVELLPLQKALGVGPSLQLSAWGSYRPFDATLNDEGNARTLITSGYHRTPTEMGKKHNTHITSAGAHAALRTGAFRLGATAMLSSSDRSIEPQRTTLYRRHYAHGSHFSNFGIDYSYTHHRWALNGETATDSHGALATVNSISLQPSARLGLVLLQRFYSYKYTSLYGHAFSDSGHTQNESGIYAGATWNPLARLNLQVYADYAYHPWARYLVSLSSHTTDILLQAAYRLSSSLTLTMRHRSRLGQKDAADKTALIANNSHYERLSIDYHKNNLNLKTRFDLSNTRYKTGSRGWMLSEHASLAVSNILGIALNASAIAAYFDTDSYQSRMYAIEPQMQNDFFFPSYYGRGMRLLLLLKADISQDLRLSVRLGHTRYFDRNVVSSGLQQIDSDRLTDLDLQVRWRL